VEAGHCDDDDGDGDGDGDSDGDSDGDGDDDDDDGGGGDDDGDDDSNDDSNDDDDDADDDDDDDDNDAAAAVASFSDYDDINCMQVDSPPQTSGGSDGARSPSSGGVVIETFDLSEHTSHIGHIRSASLLSRGQDIALRVLFPRKNLQQQQQHSTSRLSADLWSRAAAGCHCTFLQNQPSKCHSRALIQCH
jgi:cobalamin biosynthesis protein CobT